MSGKKFERLTVLSFDKIDAGRRYRWFCRCDCGIEKSIDGQYLRSGFTKSCGCLKVERARATMATNKSAFTGARLTHGMTETPTFRSWNGMIQRCTNPNRQNFFYYGGRGISVCERWRIFQNFLDDMGIRPEGKTIGRIDNEGNYELENCQWETMKQQSNNRRPRA